MRYIIAMDSFKGSLTSEEVGKAVADNLKSHDEEAEIKVLSVSDGGEGCLMHSAKPHMPHDFLYLLAML